jgi:insulin-like growth factor-binding protein complex acid labile subunit
LLTGLQILKTLNLRANSIEQLFNGTFQGLSSVEMISLDANWLSSIEPGAFQGLSSVQSLSLVQNRLSVIRTGTFEGLSSLRNLDLSDNNLGNMTAPGAFSGMPELRTLKIDYQRSSSWHFGKDTFAGNLSQLAYLSSYGQWGTQNERNTIELGAFDGLTGLESLNLDSAYVEDASLQGGLFLHCRSLRVLSMGGNRLSYIKEDTFAGLEDSLEYLNLNSNSITSISRKAFYRFKKLGQIFLNSNQLSILPVDILTNRLFNATQLEVYLYGNPLLCQPASSSVGRFYRDVSSSTLLMCPSEVSFSNC